MITKHRSDRGHNPQNTARAHPALRPALRAALRAMALSLSLALIFGAGIAQAQSVTFDLGNPESSATTERIIQLFLLVTLLSLAPSLLITLTSFTRIVVVLSFLRSALGLQQAPPNSVLVGLALFLTFFIMQPTFKTIYDDAITPLLAQDIETPQAMSISGDALRGFMIKHVRDNDLLLFMDISDQPRPESPETTPFSILIPAFMISELRRAFEIGFLLFLPFLIIDMVVASILMSMGMMMLPPIIISLPFKLVFFVLVDGWYLVAGSLVRSYG